MYQQRPSRCHSPSPLTTLSGYEFGGEALNNERDAHDPSESLD